MHLSSDFGCNICGTHVTRTTPRFHCFTQTNVEMSFLTFPNEAEDLSWKKALKSREELLKISLNLSKPPWKKKQGIEAGYGVRVWKHIKKNEKQPKRKGIWNTSAMKNDSVEIVERKKMVESKQLSLNTLYKKQKHNFKKRMKMICKQYFNLLQADLEKQ